MIILLLSLYAIVCNISLILIIIRHWRYIHILFSKCKTYSSSCVNGCYRLKITPIYKQEYFGYKEFCFVDDNYEVVTLKPDKYMRVFGIIERNSDCVIKIKNGKVLYVLPLNYIGCVGDIDCEYKTLVTIFLIIAYGGVLLWKLNILYFI